MYRETHILYSGIYPFFLLLKSNFPSVPRQIDKWIDGWIDRFFPKINRRRPYVVMSIEFFPSKVLK